MGRGSGITKGLEIIGSLQEKKKQNELELMKLLVGGGYTPPEGTNLGGWTKKDPGEAAMNIMKGFLDKQQGGTEGTGMEGYNPPTIRASSTGGFSLSTSPINFEQQTKEMLIKQWREDPSSLNYEEKVFIGVSPKLSAEDAALQNIMNKKQQGTQPGAKMIRVREIATGLTGTISEGEFDPRLYQKIK